MDYVIRNATRNDMPQVLHLIKELAAFEKEPHAVEVTADDLKYDGFGEHPAFHCFVADVNSKIEGIALIYNRYSTWKGKILHLEDLIISKSMRGKGLGTALLNKVVWYSKTNESALQNNSSFLKFLIRHKKSNLYPNDDLICYGTPCSS